MYTELNSDKHSLVLYSWTIQIGNFLGWNAACLFTDPNLKNWEPKLYLSKLTNEFNYLVYRSRAKSGTSTHPLDNFTSIPSLLLEYWAWT